MAYWHGKVVMITGASSGLGRAIALAYATAGARLVIAARQIQPLEAVAETIRAVGGEVLCVPTDVTDQAQVEELFARCNVRFGQLDVMVNNAGRSMRRATLETTADDFRELMELNLLATVRATRLAAPLLLAAKGHLVNIGSLAGKSAARYLGAYPATKFAVTGYTQQLRMELEPQGLHVLLVCTGPIARDEPRAAHNEIASAADLKGLPEGARKPGGGLRTRAIRPEQLAEKILQYCEKRKPEIVDPPIARLYLAAMQLSPRLGDFILRRMT